MSKSCGGEEFFSGFAHEVLRIKNSTFKSHEVNEDKTPAGRCKLAFAGILKVIKDCGIRWGVVGIFVCLPALLFNLFLPDSVAFRREIIIFIWFFNIILGESYVRTEVFNIKKTDRTRINDFNIDAKDNFLGKFKYKIISELVFHFSALCIMNAGIWNSISITIMTAAFRAVGERRNMGFYKRDPQRYEKKKRESFIVACSITNLALAYGIPLLFVGHMAFAKVLCNPIVVICVCIYGGFKYFVLTKSSSYKYIAREVFYE